MLNFFFLNNIFENKNETNKGLKRKGITHKLSRTNQKKTEVWINLLFNQFVIAKSNAFVSFIDNTL